MSTNKVVEKETRTLDRSLYYGKKRKNKTFVPVRGREKEGDTGNYSGWS